MYLNTKRVDHQVIICIGRIKSQMEDPTAIPHDDDIVLIEGKSESDIRSV